MLWLTVVVFIVLLLLLVLVHELGHLLAAKKAGCKVEEFGFGFPPRLFSFTYKDTLYSFNLFPIGGFVKIEGEDMEEKEPSPTSFASKSAGWRIFILSAGVLMNVALAAVLLMMQAGIGFPTLMTTENENRLTDIKSYITSVAPDSPAEEAGLAPLDRVTRIGDIEDPSTTQIQVFVAENLGQELPMAIERQGVHEEIVITPREVAPENEGALGVTLAAAGLERVPWWQAPWMGLQRTGLMLLAIVEQFWIILSRVISGGGVGETLTGPVGIAVYTNEVTRLGVPYILEFGALISLNLAIINILPIPALDGGRIVFVILEKLRGRRMAAKFEQVTHMIGFVLLIGLMLAITMRDIQRFF